MQSPAVPGTDDTVFNTNAAFSIGGVPLTVGHTDFMTRYSFVSFTVGCAMA